MAAIRPAIDRIHYLMFGGEYQKTPNTINGNEEIIYSYGMPIAGRHDNGSKSAVWITTERNSPTTNRHITAMHAATIMKGYTEVSRHTATAWAKSTEMTEWVVYQKTLTN